MSERKCDIRKYGEKFFSSRKKIRTLRNGLKNSLCFADTKSNHSKNTKRAEFADENFFQVFLEYFFSKRKNFGKIFQKKIVNFSFVLHKKKKKYPKSN